MGWRCPQWSHISLWAGPRQVGLQRAEEFFSSSFRNLYPTASFALGKNLLLAHVGAWREGHDPGWVMDALGQRNLHPQQLQGENSSECTNPPREGRTEPGTAAKIPFHSMKPFQPESAGLQSLLPALFPNPAWPGAAPLVSPCAA